MSLFTESGIRNRARREVVNFSKSASVLLAENAEKQAAVEAFDVFLSHAFDDRDLILGTILTLEDFGYSVYVDWRNDPLLDRTKVTRRTAAVLRERMRSSKSLLYAVTPAAKDSAWMKWELGWKDGDNSRVAVWPIEGSSYSDAWSGGQQFLGLYPYVANGAIRGTDQEALWIHWTSSNYVSLDFWLNGANPYEH